MKPIEEVLKEGLPPEIAQKAIANIDTGFVMYTPKCDMLEVAVSGSFAWNTAPEGYDYWQNVHNCIKKGKYVEPATLESSLNELERILFEFKTTLQEVRNAIKNEG